MTNSLFFEERKLLGAEITNTGSGDAHDVIVTFKDGKTLIGSREIAVIKAGDTVIEMIGWTPSEGEHQIIVEVEQFDGSVEEYKEKVDIEDRGGFFPNLFLTVFFLAIIITIMVIIVYVSKLDRKMKAKSPNPCPKCNTGMAFIVENNKYYCSTCNKYQDNVWTASYK